MYYLQSERERGRINHQKRYNRLKAAREKGTHTNEEWKEMLEFFEYTCCICLGSSGLKNVEKDHIIPIYQGGSDSINNLQPICAKCNSQKGSSNLDHRPQLMLILKKEMPNKYTQNG